MANRWRSVLWRYGLVAASYLLVVGLQILLGYYSIKISFAIPMIAALLAVTWYGGRGPGLLLAILFEATTILANPVPPDSTVTQWVVARVSTFTLLVFIVWMVSSRRSVKTQIRASESRYRTLFEYSPDGIVIADPQSYYLDANDKICQMLGYTRDEFIGLHASDILAQEEVPRIGEALDTIKADTEYHREWVFKRKDGSIFAGEVTATAMPDGNILAVIRDITERESAAALVRESETRLAGIIDSAMDAIITSDSAQQIVLFNAAAETMFKCTGEDAIGQSLERFIPKRFRTGHAEHVRTFGETNVTTRSMRSLGGIFGLRSDNEEFPIEASISQLESGGEKFFTVILRDITERKRHEAASNRLVAIVQSSDDAIIGKDLNSIVTTWNRGAENLFGYTAEEMEGTSILRIIPEDRYHEEAHILSKIKRGESVEHFDTVRLTKHGRTIDVSVTASPIRNTDGEVTGVSKVARDITDRKHAEEKQQRLNDDLARERGRLKNIVASVPGVVWEAWGEPDDARQQIDFVSDHIETMLGYSVEEWLSTPNFWATILHPDDKEHAVISATAAYAARMPAIHEFRWVAKDGRAIWVESHTAPILAEDGTSLGARGVTIDITKRKDLEDQFRQAQKMEAIGLLAGGIAHDFNNVLTAITGYSDLTLLKISADDPLRNYIQEIRNAGDRAAALTSQLLAFSRKQVFNTQILNINRVITEVETMLRRLIKENVVINTVLDPELGNIKADPGQIEQVIINLAVNAGDAMPNGGTLTIETENVFIDEDYVDMHITSSPGPYVRMTVTDIGDGMADAVRQHIFEPFFTTKEIGKGTGLGLSTVHGIVKQSGGNIHVYSEPGHGTTFKIYLPCVDEIAEELKVRTELGTDYSGTETILLVEDEEIVRTLVREILTGLGYDVLVADSGLAALAICETYFEPIHLLLTDVIMPGISGPTMKDQLVKLLPDIKVLFMSGYTDEAISASGTLTTGAAFIEKPFTADALARKVREVLTSRK